MRLPFVVALAFVAATAAVANATDQDKFDAAVAKFAPRFSQLFVIDAKFKPKSLCVCSGQVGGSPGFLFRDDAPGTNVFCATPIFLPDGKFAGAAVPCAPYEVLAK